MSAPTCRLDVAGVILSEPDFLITLNGSESARSSRMENSSEIYDSYAKSPMPFLSATRELGSWIDDVVKCTNHPQLELPHLGSTTPEEARAIIQAIDRAQAAIESLSGFETTQAYPNPALLGLHQGTPRRRQGLEPLHGAGKKIKLPQPNPCALRTNKRRQGNSVHEKGDARGQRGLDEHGYTQGSVKHPLA